MWLFVSYRDVSNAGSLDLGHDARVGGGPDDWCGGGCPDRRRLMLFTGLHTLHTGTVQGSLSGWLPGLYGRGMRQESLHEQRIVLCRFGPEVVPGTERMLCGQGVATGEVEPGSELLR